MPNPNRQYDKSDLTVEQYENRIILHRDIIAHSFRWSYVVKVLLQGGRYKNDVILDVGCGRDLPLPRMCYANRLTGFAYVGVDINRLEMHPQLKAAVDHGKAEVQLIGERDAGTITKSEIVFTDPSIATAFECFEHMRPPALLRLIKNVYDLLQVGGDFICSTPVFNGSAAANHINEMGYDTVGYLLERAGFHISHNHGTFANKNDIEPLVDKDYPGLYGRINKYYDSNIMAVMFAPLYPQRSRNVLWHCLKTGKTSSHFKNISLNNQIPEWKEYLNEAV
jgi:SAM-dependent methyltransferase